MVGLGLLLIAIGIILWVTVFPVIGWTLIAIGVVAAIVGLIVGAVWGLTGSGRRTRAY